MIFTNTFTFAKKPNKLNFAVQGTLTIDGVVFDDIVLAQGHHGATNNWWFGGKNCWSAHAPVDFSECTSRNGDKWCFTRGRSGYFGYLIQTGANKIKVDKKSCDDVYSELQNRV